MQRWAEFAFLECIRRYNAVGREIECGNPRKRIPRFQVFLILLRIPSLPEFRQSGMKHEFGTVGLKGNVSKAMQNAKPRMQNAKLDIVLQFCILGFAFCISNPLRLHLHDQT